jgi:hypothetical protein
MDLKVAATAQDIGLATTLKGLLESAGIESVLAGSNQSIYPGTSLAEIRILVREEDLAQARELIDQADAGSLAEDDEEE